MKKLSIVINGNSQAMASKEDMAHMLRLLADQLEQLPTGQHSCPLYDRTMVRVGYFELIGPAGQH